MVVLLSSDILTVLGDLQALAEPATTAILQAYVFTMVPPITALVSFRYQTAFGDKSMIVPLDEEWFSSRASNKSPEFSLRVSFMILMAQTSESSLYSCLGITDTTILDTLHLGLRPFP